MSLGLLPWVYPVWDSLGFLDLDGYFFTYFREVFDCYLLKYILIPFFLPSSSGTSVIQMFGCLTLPQRSLGLSSFILILFSFFLSASFISTILSSTSLILSSVSYSTVGSLQNAFNLSYYIFPIIDWLYFF